MAEDGKSLRRRLLFDEWWECLLTAEAVVTLRLSEEDGRRRIRAPHGDWPRWTETRPTRAEETAPRGRYDVICLDGEPNRDLTPDEDHRWRRLVDALADGGRLLVILDPGAGVWSRAPADIRGSRRARIVRALRRAGMRVETIACAYPHRSDVRYCVPLAPRAADSCAFWQLVVPGTRAGRAQKRLLRAIGVGRLAPAFAIKATRPGTAARPTQLAVWLERTRASLGRADELRWSGGVLSSGQSLINLLSDAERRPVAILKVPLTRSSRLEHAAAATVREQIRRDHRLPAHLRALMPTSLWSGEDRGRYAEADAFCPGVPGHLYLRRHPRRQDELVRRSTTFLTELHRATAMGHSSLHPAIEERWRRLVGPHSPAPDVGRAVVVPRVVSHNDVHPANLLLEGGTGELRAVLDWQFAELEGWPGLDVISMVVWTRAFQRHQSWHASFCEVLAALVDTQAPERVLLERYCGALGLTPQACPPLLLLYYLEQRLRERAYGGSEPPDVDQQMSRVVRDIVTVW